MGLITASKPESMDICFVPNCDYASIVKKLRPEGSRPGDIVHMDGRVVGKHDGIVGYTVGQRKGIGVGGGITEDNSPLFVVQLNADKNQVVVGPKEALARDVVFVRDVNWLVAPEAGQITVKLRSTTQPQPALLEPTSDGAKVTLLEPQYGISPGQAAVFYDGSRVLGGGWIAATARSSDPMASAA